MSCIGKLINSHAVIFYVKSCNISDKKRRELNFSAKEEQILTCLVKKYSIILENKKTDSDMNKKKHALWVILCKEFNGQSGDTYRSIDALKNKYLNLKRSAKKKFSEEKRKLYETGGGPLVKVPDSIVDVDIREILASQMTGFDSQFDSDRPGMLSEENVISFNVIHFFLAVLDSENITDTIEDENTCPTSEQVPSTSKVESFVLEENSPPCSIKKDWSKQTVTNLRTPVSEKLNVTADGSIRKRGNVIYFFIPF